MIYAEHLKIHYPTDANRVADSGKIHWNILHSVSYFECGKPTIRSLSHMLKWTTHADRVTCEVCKRIISTRPRHKAGFAR